MARSYGHPVESGRDYARQAMRTPLLSEEREYQLAVAWRSKGDEAALHELVTAYMRLVVAVAARYSGYGLPKGDLVQEGSVGLMQAAARFEPERKVRFSTYASWWIRSAIQEYILRNWSIVRSGTSATQKALFFNLRYLRAQIERQGQSRLEPAARDKIARAFKISPAEIEAMSQRLAARDQSLNETVGENGNDEIQDFLADPSPTPEEVAIERRDRAIRAKWLNDAIGNLSPRERLIVRERLLREERATLEEIGSHLGITKERVRQIEHKAIAKLRLWLSQRYGFALSGSAA
jgi:RNA polymerase sigma-32 factor